MSMKVLALLLVIILSSTASVFSFTITALKRYRYSNHTDVTTVPPCCSDLIGSLTCKRLNDRDPLVFNRRCQKEADFSMIQCCNSCGLDDAPERYAKFFDANTDSEHCFDRMSPNFCAKFLNKRDFWSSSIWSCDGISANLAFRICRRTCGFCNKNLYSKDDGYYQPTPCGIAPEFIPYSKKAEMLKRYKSNSF
ncbi:unnamed protein product [Enterobius vermicularis]|uniref:ShKT domain-containing protein n=1 Tax=Enterobius vermicularis TaxID=51028 RepID=A0A0N4VJQ4_ENTVE|nr:unnamed protein product [Enterobius vermicularis]